MLAYGYANSGGAAPLIAIEQPDLMPASDQIVLTTLAVNINRADHLNLTGHLTLPLIPGHDVVGRISQIGSSVTGLPLGTLVAAYTTQTYAEQVIVDEDKLVPLPDELPALEAVSVITPGITAYKIVHYFADVQPGQTVIVKGAAGSVGRLVVQLAKRLGATVLAVAEQRHTRLLQALGVQQIIAYDQQNPAHVLANRGDVVINVAPNGLDGKTDLAMAKFDATIVSMAPSLPATSKAIVFKTVQPTDTISDTAVLQTLFKLLQTKQIQTQVGYQLPFTLAGFTQAQELLTVEHNGRIVVAKTE
ncbi:alcohol dehydrogenase [Lactobacillus sp.] [Lactiplantibacillus mudanjiangensis]|uniref:NADP-dependent oxidoreductase n=1 Tax=Lactiplantibacillus mudanjiangensis TaxID=1296538 RepID=UPI001014F1F2|nr:alcohol dehydrogenase [Lactobacillus sp.] [Lactiplantibacillus mudanjiangensis]